MSTIEESLLKPVRLMAPNSMKVSLPTFIPIWSKQTSHEQCTACGEVIYSGRKINARKERTDLMYNDITVYRFYIECARCSQEITFKTDPKNMDYEVEKGANRIS